MELLFFVNVAWIVIHELDAIHRHEWRLFQSFVPGYGRLSDAQAFRVFAALHLPLLVLILWGLPHTAFQAALDVFLLVHIGLHRLFRNHPANEFNNWFSQVWIVGVAPFAALHLLLTLG